MKTTSCGTFLIRKVPEAIKYEVLLILKDHERRAGWVLPKGGMETGESFEQTAIRETQEETGVENVVIVCNAGEYSYEFQKNGEKVIKTVKYYLAFTDYVENQILKVGTTESEKLTQKDTRWFDINESLEHLREEQDIKIMNQILTFLKNAI